MCCFHQAVAFCKSLSISFDLSPTPVRFRSGKGAELGMGKIGLRILLPNGTVPLFRADIVRAYIPVLFGLDVMRVCGLRVDFDKDDLRSLSPPWTMQIAYQLGHAFSANPV